MGTEFKHYQHAHCESGVTANLLRHDGINITEPMAFGIGAGMFFGHLPFVKVNGTPGSTFRTWPGAIFKRVMNRLGVEMHTERFRSPEKAMQALDAVLAQGRPVGILCSVYYLPFMPEAFRFHFNAHNTVIYGKEGDEYLVSDPILEDVARIKYDDLVKARFAKGTPEPRGFMYYIKNTPANIDYEKAIKAGIKQTSWFMLSPPLPWFGNSAIFLLANRIKKYPQTLPPRKAALYLGNVIRMQEEIGTGGAGFRFLHAAFLQEAGEMLKRDDLLRFSEELTAIGDDWRNFAYHAARIMKARQSDLVSYDELSGLLRICGEKEKDFFKRMDKIKW
ncbi:BtrH N-terminal domain-containing protein [Polluticoccus soli]|uniref:BtrH N-terminal domain-containing protein n=1 Tax=Polluticoccus soli TaxID=3034150 RepID=UPI0023E253CE|nr:BtrH N-terminal domain-containing protein [Flavipsychrobacter sp. JY13-12]